MWADDQIRNMASRQHGVMARRQLTAAGIGAPLVRSRIQSGMLEVITPRVLRLTGVPPSDEQGIMIPCLHVGLSAVVSHQAAAAMWGISGFRLNPIHLSIERNQHCEQGLPHVVVHHSTTIPDWCRKQIKGVPVVSPALAIYQLAGSVSVERVTRALDSAWSLRLLNGAMLDSLIERLGRSGRNGTVLMRRLRAARPDEWVPPASNIEGRFDSMMQDAGIVSFRRQVDVGGDEWSGRVDFLDDDFPLIVEILSERYHTSLTDQRADAERRERHTAMGFLVIEVWDWEIFHRPWEVVARVNAARQKLRFGDLR